MPDKPSYFQSLIQSLDEFKGLTQDWIDCQTVAQLVGVSRSTARRIMLRCGAQPGPGGSLACSKDAFLRAVESIQTGGDAVFELTRRERVQTNLEKLAAVASLRHVEIARGPAAVDLLSSRLARLPAGVSLEKSRLTVEFKGSRDLFSKLYALAAAMGNDFQVVLDFLDGPENSSFNGT